MAGEAVELLASLRFSWTYPPKIPLPPRIVGA